MKWPVLFVTGKHLHTIRPVYDLTIRLYYTEFRSEFSILLIHFKVLWNSFVFFRVCPF